MSNRINGVSSSSMATKYGIYRTKQRLPRPEAKIETDIPFSVVFKEVCEKREYSLALIQVKEKQTSF